MQRKFEDVNFENELIKHRENKYKDELESINKSNIHEVSNIENK